VRITVGLYYNGARYLAAWLGRWTSADPIGIGADGPGLYNYTRGSPVNYVDPSGTESWLGRLVQASQREDAAAIKISKRNVAARAAVDAEYGDELNVAARKIERGESPVVSYTPDAAAKIARRLEARADLAKLRQEEHKERNPPRGQSVWRAPGLRGWDAFREGSHQSRVVPGYGIGFSMGDTPEEGLELGAKMSGAFALGSTATRAAPLVERLTRSGTAGNTTAPQGGGQISGQVSKADPRASSPIRIPSETRAEHQAKTGYDQVRYRWTDDGKRIEARWHTRTPGAPPEQGDTWVVTRTTPGTTTGQRQVQHVLTGPNEWTTMQEWQAAVTANQHGVATTAQQGLLRKGHWQPK